MSTNPDVPDVSSSSTNLGESSDTNPQRPQNRHDLTAYIRRFSAVIRRKRSHVGHDSPSTPTSPQAESFTPTQETHDSLSYWRDAGLKIAAEEARRQRNESDDAVATISPRVTPSEGDRSSSKASSNPTRVSIATTIDRASVHDQRAQQLFAKYGLSMRNTSDASNQSLRRVPSFDTLLRVERRARLRMHSSCHRCQTVFAAGSKHCRKCAHKRCRECPRAAPKGVRDLVNQTKSALQNIPEPRRNPVAGAILPALQQRMTNNAANDSRSHMRTRAVSHVPDVLALLPDSNPYDHREEDPVPRMEDILNWPCPFTVTRKISQRFLDAVNNDPHRRDPGKTFGASFSHSRVYKEPRQRRRFACRSCGSQFAGLGGYCLGCSPSRMSICMTPVY